MDRRALQHTLERRRRLGLLRPAIDQISQLVVEIIPDLLSQSRQCDTAGA